MRASLVCQILIRFLGSVCVLVAVSGCSEPALSSLKLAGQTMGTTYHVTIVGPSEAYDRQGLQKSIDIELQQVNALASTYIEDSELNKLNRAPLGTWSSVPTGLFSMLETSVYLNRISDGAYDITVGPLVDYWGFGAGNSGKWREETSEAVKSEVELIKQKVGMAYLVLDSAAKKAKRVKPISLDLSSIAKGYGVDKIANLLEAKGIQNYLVEIGGEVKVSGINATSKAWKIGIEAPALGHEGVVQAIPLHNQAVATSGDYRNYYEEDGRRLSHTIDPRTGFPIAHNLASVTVIAENTALADGLATMFNVMGYEKSIQLADAEGIPVYFLVREADSFIAYHSKAFAPFLQKESLR